MSRDNYFFKPLKFNRVFSKKICGFDVETFQEEANKDGIIPQNFLCGSVFGDDVSEFFKDRHEMGQFLLSKKLRNYYIYATNLEFDFMHIYNNTKLFPEFRLIDRGGIIYAKHNKNNNIHEFLDTWNYTGRIKLEEMGEYLNIPKLPQPKAFKRVPINVEEWEEMRNYNINDSKITYNFAKFFCYDFCRKINAYPKMTIASTGMDFWRRNHQKIIIFQEPHDIIEKHYQGSIHGGRTECIIRGKINVPIYLYDYNSHYPARCYYGTDNKGSYPLPSSWHRAKKGNTELIEHYEGITYCRVKVPYSYIPFLGITNKEGRYIFPYGTFEGWFTNVELRFAMNNGTEITECGEMIYYTDTFIPFKGAVAQLYALRKEYKEKGDILMATMIKTLMNSGLYGKFAQKITGKTDIIHQDNICADKAGVVYSIDELGEKKFYDSWIQRSDIFICKTKGELHIPIFINPILSSYTTALGRIKLWNEINKKSENVLYYDTDSIFSFKKCYEDSSELGELKFELSTYDSLFIKPKFYMMYDTVNNDYRYKIKGLGKKPDSEMFKKILDGKRIDYMKFSRFKESKSRKVGFSYILPVFKDFSLEDTKREWKRKFSPICMENSEPLSVDI